MNNFLISLCAFILICLTLIGAGVVGKAIGDYFSPSEISIIDCVINNDVN